MASRVDFFCLGTNDLIQYYLVIDRADQSVAEVSAAVSALASREYELAAAMYQRLRARWRDLKAVELGS